MRVLILAVLGATLGAGGDRVHVMTSVLWYPDPAFFGQALWVPPLFAAAALALAYGHRLVMWRAGVVRPQIGLQGAALRSALFLGAYLLTGLLQDYPVSLTLGLGLGFVPLAWWLERSWVFVGYALATAVVGASFEAALSLTGAFFYTRPDLVVPMWLPSLYLWAALFGAGADRAYQGAGQELKSASQKPWGKR